MFEVDADSIDEGSWDVKGVPIIEEDVVEGDWSAGAIMCDSRLGGERMGRVGEDAELCRRL